MKPTVRRRLIVAGLMVLGTAAVVGGALWYAGSNPVAPGLAGCAPVRDFDAQQSCYVQRLSSLVERGELRGALARVDERAGTDEQLREHCHLALHAIGERHAAATGGTPLDDVGPGGDCRDGYVHGYLIGSMGGAASADALCRSAARAGEDAVGTAYDCMHSFGHVATREAGAAVALERCTSAQRETSADARTAQALADTCAWGAYMELAFAADDWEALAGECDELAAGARVGCYRFLPVGAGMTGVTEDAIASTCERAAPDGQLLEACVRGMAERGGAAQCERLSSASLTRRCRAWAAG